MDIERVKLALEIADLISDGETAKYEAADLTAKNIGKDVIVRGTGAGVVFGTLVGKDGSTIHLRNAIQMWRWRASKGGTLLDCAEFGVDPKNCKFSPARGMITVFGACALIYCTDHAAESIRNANEGEWK